MVHERYRQADDRQTDGRAIAYSEPKNQSDRQKYQMTITWLYSKAKKKQLVLDNIIHME